MKTLLIALVGAALMACEPSGEPPSPPAPPDTVEAPADSVPDKPGKSGDAPGQEKKLETAQECRSSLVVNGFEAVRGNLNVDVESLPTQLDISLRDCPNSEVEVRGNYVQTGFGSGEFKAIVLKRGAIPIREFSRVGSSRIVLGAERPSIAPQPDREPGTAGSRAIVTDSNEAMVKWITRPGGYIESGGTAATVPLDATATIFVRNAKADPGDRFKVEIQVSQFDSEGGNRAITFREVCSEESRLSPAKYDC